MIYNQYGLFHVQTEHSLGRGSMTMREVFERAKEVGAAYIVLAENETLTSIVEAYDLMQEYKIPICVGVEARVHWNSHNISADGNMLFLPKDKDGYLVIGRMLSEAYRQHRDGVPWMDYPFLERWIGKGAPGHGHIVLTTGGGDGILMCYLRKFFEDRESLQRIRHEIEKLHCPSDEEYSKVIEEKERLCQQINQASSDNDVIEEYRKAQKKAVFYLKCKKKLEVLQNKEKVLEEQAVSEMSIKNKISILLKAFQNLVAQDNFFIEMAIHYEHLESEIFQLLKSVDGNYQMLFSNDARYTSNTEHNIRRQKLIEYIHGADEQPNIDRKWHDYSIHSKSELQKLASNLFPEEFVKRAIAGQNACWEQCAIVEMERKKYYPKWRGEESGGKQLMSLIKEGIYKHFPNLAGWTKIYAERLREELNVIIKMDYADYFCIVFDIIRYAHELEYRAGKGTIYVGPGRGSAVGSLTCYLLGITMVDPIKYHLLFSRFLSPMRSTMPDIDTDLSPKIYGAVLAYVKERYGDRAVSAIVTKGRLGPKQALEYAANYHKASVRLKEVMRDSLSDEIEVLGNARELKRFAMKNKKVDKILNDAILIEGRRVNIGQHASGLVISDVEDISKRIPIMYNNRTGNWMTQMDMEDVERQGLLKIDLLKLRTLDIISDTFKAIKNRGAEVNIEPPICENVFRMLFSTGNTKGVFQLESDGVRNFLRRFRPQNEKDLILLISIYRPGPIQYADKIIDAKNKNEIKEWESPKLNAVLKESYGYPVYQEQVMRIFHEIAGFSLEEADLIRRAISHKKSSDLLVPYKEPLLQGLKRDGMAPATAEQFWHQLLEFGKFAFNLSHAVAYAKLTYLTGYLKYFYPTEYLCAILNNCEKERVPEFLKECQRFHVMVLKPDLNESEAGFTIAYDKTIRFGLHRINGVSSAAVSRIIEARKNGPFASFKQYLMRAHQDKSSTKMLILSGAMDSFTDDRSALLETYPRFLELWNATIKEMDKTKYRRFLIELTMPSNSISQKISDYEEEKIMGYSLNSLKDYRVAISRMESGQYPKDSKDKNINFYGFIQNIVNLKRKKDGKEFAVFTVEGEEESIEAVCYTEEFARLKPFLEEKKALWFRGNMRYEKNEADQIIEKKLIVHQCGWLNREPTPLKLSLPSVIIWDHVYCKMKQYEETGGCSLYIEDRLNGIIYKADFCVSETIIKKFNWNKDIYLEEFCEASNEEHIRMSKQPSDSGEAA